MGRRAAAVEETKRRIVQATLELHRSQGILATSWEDIAKRADVAPATVYRHFPTLDELLPACGALSMQQLQLPTVEEAKAALSQARGRRARLRRMVELVFGIYERGPEILAEIHRSRGRLAVVEADHRKIEERLDAIVAAALAPLKLADVDARMVRALVDFDAWHALSARGIDGEDAVAAMAELLDAWLARRRR
jgi:AcrR family transcriptional regulator